MRNRFVARLVLAFVLFSIVVPASAIIPLIVNAVRVSTAYLRTPAGQQLILGVSLLPMGAAVHTLGVDRTDGTNTRSDQFVFADVPPRQPSAEESAAGFTEGYPELVAHPPETTSGIHQFSYSSSFTVMQGSFAAACSAYAVLLNASSSYLFATSWCHVVSASFTGDAGMYDRWVCPGGYLPPSGSATCTRDPAAGDPPPPPDGVCPIVRHGNVFEGATGDPDCSDGQGATLTHPSEGVSVWEWTPGTTPQSARLTANADGTWTFEQAIPDEENNVTRHPAVSLSPTASPSVPPTIIGSGETVNPGIGTQEGTTPLPPGTVPTAPPPTIELPTDYARQGEAQAAADSLSEGFVAPTGEDPVAAMDNRIAAIADIPASVPAINWVPSLLPGSFTACQPIQVDGNVTGGLLNGFTATTSFDICDKLDLLRQFFGYLCMLVTGVYIFRVFTRSNQGV